MFTVELDKNVDVTVGAFFATGKRAKDPCFLYGLGGEIIANLFIYIGIHAVMIYFAKIHNIFEPTK